MKLFQNVPKHGIKCVGNQYAGAKLGLIMAFFIGFAMFSLQVKALPGYAYDLNVTVTNPDVITHTREIAKINLTGLTLLTNNCTKELIGYNSTGLMDYFLYNSDESTAQGEQWCDVEFMVPSITAAQSINYTFYYGNSSADEKEHIVSWVYDDFSRNNIYSKLWNNTFQIAAMIPCSANSSTSTVDCNRNFSAPYYEQGVMTLNYSGTQFTQASTFNISVSVLIEADENADCGPLFTGKNNAFYNMDMFTMDAGTLDNWRWYNYESSSNIQVTPKNWNIGQFYNHTFDYTPTGAWKWYVDDLLGISGTYAGDDFTRIGLGSWRCPIKIDEAVFNANHYFDKQVTETITYNYVPPLLVDFIPPTDVNGTETENKNYITWNMSVSLPPVYGIFQINNTNYSANCQTDYCYFNETGILNNQTRCALAWGNSGTIINSTEEYVCRTTVFMTIIPPTNYTGTGITIELSPESDLPIVNMTCINDNNLRIERSKFHTIDLLNGTIYGYYDNSTEEIYCDNGCYENIFTNGSGCAPPIWIIAFLGFVVLIVGIWSIRFIWGRRR